MACVLGGSGEVSKNAYLDGFCTCITEVSFSLPIFIVSRYPICMVIAAVGVGDIGERCFRSLKTQVKMSNTNTHSDMSLVLPKIKKMNSFVGCWKTSVCFMACPLSRKF